MRYLIVAAMFLSAPAFAQIVGDPSRGARLQDSRRAAEQVASHRAQAAAAQAAAVEEENRRLREQAEQPELVESAEEAPQ